MTIYKKLESVKDEKSYSSPAKRTMEKLKPILSQSSVLADRWVWELLQNASDLGDSVSVQFYLDNDYLKFKHNGKLFDLEEAFNLIMPDSNKDGQTKDDSVIKQTIGQFGTGFISTHIISSKIIIKGVVEDNEDQSLYRFEFCLDRSERDDKSKLIESIKAAESQYGKSLRKIEGSEREEYSTEFIYHLNSNYEGLDAMEIVDQGLSILDDLLPYVLPFRT